MEETAGAPARAAQPQRLPPDEFARVVEHTTLVSVDVLLFDTEGRVLLGRREKEPAKGAWFTPGGRVYKNECLDAAALRVLSTEVLAPTPDQEGRGRRFDLRRRFDMHGVYRHLYDTSFLENGAFGTDYVNFAYTVRAAEHYDAASLRALEALERPPVGEADADGQHGEFRWFRPEDVMRERDVHPYVKCYFQPAAYNRLA